MKTSSKILIGLLSIIIIVMFAFFLDTLVFGENRYKRFENPKSEEIPLENFKHICVNNLQSLRIAASDKNYFHLIVFNDTVAPGITYKIENDTLKITENPIPQIPHNYTLYTNSIIKSISVTKAKLNILNGFIQDSICLKVSDGQIDSWSNNKNEFSRFKNIKVTQLNSKLTFYNIKVDTLKLNLYNSSAKFYQDFNVISAKIESKSNLQIKDVGKLEIEKDESSRLLLLR